MQEAEIRRITARLACAKKVHENPSQLKKKKMKTLGTVVCACHPSPGGKTKIGGSHPGQPG
jgi:hypothetical protein